MIYIKILGAVLIITSSCGIGAFVGTFQNKRTGDIKELILFAGIIKGCLTYTASEVADIIEQGAKKTNGAVSRWLFCIADRLSDEKKDTFENIWLECMETLINESYLSGEVLSQAAELGKWLCYMDADSQIKNIAVWEKNIESEYEKQQKKAAQINKVSRSLGLLGGIFLVILIC